MGVRITVRDRQRGYTLPVSNGERFWGEVTLRFRNSHLVDASIREILERTRISEKPHVPTVTAIRIRETKLHRDALKDVDG